MAVNPNPSFSFRAREDFKLVKRALDKSDQKAYTELMARYRDSVFYVLMKMVYNPEDAEDITLETFSKAFKNLDRYDPSYSFSTWLYKIASNSAIDFIRKKKRDKSPKQDTMSIDEPIESKQGDSININLKSGTLDPEEKFVKEQRKKVVQKYVNNLSPKYKLLIELRYFKEFSYQEIADELDQPLGTIKAQLSRAREELLQLLKESKEKF